MARRSEENANTEATIPTTRRSFAFDTSNLLEEIPVLPTGTYAAIMFNPSIEGKDSKQHIQVVAETLWDKTSKTRKPTGDYLIQGNIYYGVELTGKKAKKDLGKDEPRFYNGKININTIKFNPENPDSAWQLDDTKNTCLAKATKILNIDMNELTQSVSHIPVDNEGNPTFDLETLKETFKFTDNEEDIDPSKDILSEDVLNHPDVEFMLNYVLFYRELFTLVCQQMNLQEIGANIEKRMPDQWNKLAVPDNAIQLGNSFTPTSPGFIAYKEGMN
jgi:hypothetical protein